MTRQRSALRAPTVAALARIPEVRVGTTVFHRATWDRHGPWWFATRSDDPAAAGRFDLQRPRGTCYLADDPVAAVVEKLTDPDDLDRLVSRAELERVVVWSGRLDRPPTVADTTARSSRVPKELGTIVPFDLPWTWADALDAAARNGVLSWLRLDPTGSRGLAVFGPAGACDARPALTAAPATAWADELADILPIEEPPAAGDLVWAADPR